MIWEFSSFSIDDRSLELRQDGRALEASPKVFSLLLTLAQRAPAVVSNEELREALWPGVRVTESSLRQTLKLARRLLGHTELIQTVRGRGLRLGTPVTRRDDRGSSAGMLFGAGDFVGRDAELACLHRCLDQALRGTGELVIVTGPAGIGKSKLLQELVRRVDPDRQKVVWGRCRPEETSPPFWPWPQLMRRLLHSTPHGLSSGAPLVGDVAHSNETELASWCGEGVPHAARFRMFSDSVALLRRLSETAPLLILLEDMHVAGEPTRALLEFVTGELADCTILVVVTWREHSTTEEASLERWLTSVSPAPQVLTLSPFTLDETARYVYSTGAMLARSEILEFHRLSAGNPLFLREAVRYIGTRSSEEPTEFSAVELPSSLRRLITQRVHSVPGDGSRLIEVASVIGHDVEILVLKRVGAWSDRSFASALELALGSRLLHETSPGRLSFSHVLVRDVSYEALEPETRRELHERVALVLEGSRLESDSGKLDAIAFHFGQAIPRAGAAERALVYLERASQAALVRTAYEKAASSFARAFELARALEKPERELFELLLARGRAERLAGERATARTTLVSAIEWARDGGDASAMADAVLEYAGLYEHRESGRADQDLVDLLEEALAKVGSGDSSRRARLLARLTTALTFSPDYERRLEHAEAAIAVARRSSDQCALATALAARLSALVGVRQAAQYEREKRLADELAELARVTGDADRALHETMWSLVAQLEQGDYAAASLTLDGYSTLAQSWRHATHRWFALTMAASCATLRGEFERGERLALAAFELGRRAEASQAGEYLAGHMWSLRLDQGRLEELLPALQETAATTPNVPVWRSALSLAHCEMGNTSAARVEFESAVAYLDELPRTVLWQVPHFMLARVAASLGDVSRAGLLYERLLPYSTLFVVVGSICVVLGPVDYALGRLARTFGDLEAAYRHLEAAHAQCRSMGARPWLARVELALAESLVARAPGSGSRVRAARLLGDARETAQQLGMTRLLEQIEAAKI